MCISTLHPITLQKWMITMHYHYKAIWWYEYLQQHEYIIALDQPIILIFWYYFDLKIKRTSNGWGCSTIPGIISFGSRSGKDFPSGSITVANCINVDMNRNKRDLAKTSPRQFLFPDPKAKTLKRKTNIFEKRHFQNKWITIDKCKETSFWVWLKQI